MNIYCIQQVFFEGPSIIKDWAEERQHNFNIILMYDEPELPAINEVDGLVIMGGPMSVQDEDKYAWLKMEKDFIKICIDANKPVVGICLGSQLLAEVLGAKVYPNKYKEIGWLNVEFNERAALNDIFKGLPNNFTTFQWHGDTFDLPEGADLLASSEACKNQAFQFKNVLGLQFHAEMVIDRIEELAHYCESDLGKGKYIQTKEELLNKEHVSENHRWMKTVLDRFFISETPF